MLNPSSADAFRDDPTIKRCTGFALRLGFGSFQVGNLFAWRSSRPADLLQCQEPIGQENLQHLESMAGESHSIICAWGNNITLKGMGIADGRQLLPPIILQKPLYILRLSKDGIPVHPLYLPEKTEPFLWNV
jgi:hypothetical protein